MIASLRERIATGAHYEKRPVGTAGDRVAIERMLWSGGPSDGRFEIEYFAVSEADEDLLIPLGISYFTFKLVHYVYEVSRERIEEHRLELCHPLLEQPHHRHPRPRRWRRKRS